MLTLLVCRGQTLVGLTLSTCTEPSNTKELALFDAYSYRVDYTPIHDDAITTPQ